METIVKLKVNPTVEIVFTDCSPSYYPDTREIVIANLEGNVKAVYDADELVGEIIFRW